MLPRLVRVCPKTPKHKNWLSNTGLKLLWDYTNIVMNFLCGPQTSDSCSTLNFEWLRFFNVVTTGSAKQSLFHDENRANLFEVEPASRMLLNTDNGTPMPQVGGALRLPLKSLNKSCKVFQVLYVGDHIYGDILRSKKVLGYTMLDFKIHVILKNACLSSRSLRNCYLDCWLRSCWLGSWRN
ncbi:cytosolic purine 5'-nucleotidase-like isoform X10 [Camellia sinensis]|uniref:cytosolic purine 5'-nucleotidase-like isoform X10 n=1 Tax=Camellia sinensis TaxID=4442 RepID=UPI001035B513|nr:cytosolic purine 5'-nucleotidase-like isoform X10 [Camellia sinensis]